MNWVVPFQENEALTKSHYSSTIIKHSQKGIENKSNELWTKKKKWGKENENSSSCNDHVLGVHAAYHVAYHVGKT